MNIARVCLCNQSVFINSDKEYYLQIFLDECKYVLEIEIWWIQLKKT